MKRVKFIEMVLGTVYDFSIGDSSIKKEDILNICQYLIIKNNIMFGFIKKYLSGIKRI